MASPRNGPPPPVSTCETSAAGPGFGVTDTPPPAGRCAVTVAPGVPGPQAVIIAAMTANNATVTGLSRARRARATDRFGRPPDTRGRRPTPRLKISAFIATFSPRLHGNNAGTYVREGVVLVSNFPGDHMVEGPARARQGEGSGIMRDEFVQIGRPPRAGHRKGPAARERMRRPAFSTSDFRPEQRLRPAPGGQPGIPGRPDFAAILWSARSCQRAEPDSRDLLRSGRQQVVNGHRSEAGDA
ncbi:hypothetical protein FAIPA1_20418 [Frankia sp. AiPs1]